MSTAQLNYSNLPKSIQLVIQKIISSSEPTKLILFGSRARKTHRENSDIDLCVMNRRSTDAEWNQLVVSIEQDPHSLYKVDLVEFEKLSKVYQDEIMKEGITLYESNL